MKQSFHFSTGGLLIKHSLLLGLVILLVFFARSAAFLALPPPSPAKSGHVSLISRHATVEGPNERKSKALPWLDRPAGLDSVPEHLAGDHGFDPLHLADTESTLLHLRKAELKHSRLAMLAVTGYLLAELYGAYLADALGAPQLTPGVTPQGTCFAPSPWNGGLDLPPRSFWALVAMASAEAELRFEALVPKNAEPKRHAAGEYGWDPLKLFPGRGDPEGRETVRGWEVAHGRAAMLAFVA
ncbi:unnamed protein product, partial [Heterosigma akashiwo]